MPEKHAFDITVAETTAKTAAADLEGAMKSGAAMHAHDQVVAGEDVTGWTADHRDLVAAVCEAAADVVAKLAPKGKARVSANGDATHANVSVQVLR